MAVLDGLANTSCYTRIMRITGGVLRSRRLAAPPGDRTRPTADRVREALFSILDARASLARVRVLDLYAGTGALGLEALSRGAGHVTFVEAARDAVRVLEKNCLDLGVTERTTVHALAVERCWTKVLRGGPFALVFADPPYADVRDGRLVRAVDASLAGLLEPAGTFVLEHGKGDRAPLIAGLSAFDARAYGDTALAFYRRAAQER